MCAGIFHRTTKEGASHQRVERLSTENAVNEGRMLRPFTQFKTNDFLNQFFSYQIKFPDATSSPKQISNSEAELYTYMLQDKTVLQSKGLLLYMVDRLASYDRNSGEIEFFKLLRMLSALTCKYTEF